jgi:hypothetical protein
LELIRNGTENGGFVKATMEGENAKNWLLRGYKGR